MLSFLRNRFLFREHFSRVYLYLLRLQRQLDRQTVMQQRQLSLKAFEVAAAAKTPAASQSRLSSLLSRARSILSGGHRKKVQSESVTPVALPPAVASAQQSSASPFGSTARPDRSSNSSPRRVGSSPSGFLFPEAERKLSNTGSASTSTASSTNAPSSTSASAAHSRTSTETESSCCADGGADADQNAEYESDLSEREHQTAAMAVAIDALATLALGSSDTDSSTVVSESSSRTQSLLAKTVPTGMTVEAPGHTTSASELVLTSGQTSASCVSHSVAARSLAEILPALSDPKYDKKLRKMLRLNNDMDLRLIRVCRRLLAFI